MTYAMILCAGFGTRLGELTKDTPKPMLEIGGKPMLEHTINCLKSAGINKIVINLHYLADKITSYFGDGSKFGVEINYIYEESPSGTAGAVDKARHILKHSENFLVLYGDIITNQDYKALIDFHNSKPDAVASIIMHERAKSNSIIEIDENNRIINFIERPGEEDLKNKKQNWVNSGLYCFHNEILSLIPEKQKCDFPKDIFPGLVSNWLIYGFPLTGYRCAIDSPERYFAAKSDYEKGTVLI